MAIRAVAGPTTALDYHDRQQPSSVVDDFAEVVRRFPSQIAVTEPTDQVTYQELDQLVSTATSTLIDGGLAAGDLISIHGPVSAVQLACALAAWRCGAVVWMEGSQEPSDMQDIVCDAELLSVSVDAPARAIDVRRIRGLPARTAAVVGELGARRDEIIAAGGAYLVRTSGSTGRRKHILGDLRSLSAFVRWQAAEFAFNTNDRVAVLTSVGFDVVYRELFTALTSGATLMCPPSGLRPSGVLPWLERTECSILHVVPSLARFWLTCAPDGMPTLRATFFAGEPLDVQLLDEWRSRTGRDQVIINLYGPSETTLAKFYYRVPLLPPGSAVPVGQPLPGTSAIIRHLETDEAICDGSAGEVVIVTSHGSLGYVGDHPSEVLEKFRRDGDVVTFRTGDVGLVRDEGLVLLGRVDSAVKINGVWVNCHDVESTLRAHEAVEDAAVLAMRTDRGVRLHAFVVTADHGPLHNLRRHVLHVDGIASVPHRMTRLESLPRLSNGKLDRVALHSLASGDRFDAHRPDLSQVPAVTS